MEWLFDKKIMKTAVYVIQKYNILKYNSVRSHSACIISKIFIILLIILKTIMELTYILNAGLIVHTYKY